MIWSLFNQKTTYQNKQRHPTLPNLDDTLYPMQWESQVFTSAHNLMLAVISDDNQGTSPKQDEISRVLYNNDIYQSWINFTVFGRYIQRSFAAFYRQSEDVFNMDMPDLLRHELMRHAQYLPDNQTLFFAGQLPLEARTNKLFTTTLNPATALKDAQVVRSSKQQIPQYIINEVTVKGVQVLGFAVRHNARTSERLRNEVMILNFQTLRLVNEDVLQVSESCSIAIRHYELR